MYIYTYVNISTCIPLYIHIYIKTCTCVCIYMCVYTHTRVTEHFLLPQGFLHVYHLEFDV